MTVFEGGVFSGYGVICRNGQKKMARKPVSKSWDSQPKKRWLI